MVINPILIMDSNTWYFVPWNPISQFSFLYFILWGKTFSLLIIFFLIIWFLYLIIISYLLDLFFWLYQISHFLCICLSYIMYHMLNLPQFLPFYLVYLLNLQKQIDILHMKIEESLLKFHMVYLFWNHRFLFVKVLVIIIPIFE